MPNRRADQLLCDANAPMSMRLELLRQLVGTDEATPVLTKLLESAGSAAAGEQVRAKAKELSRAIKELQSGPLRCGIFDRLVEEGGIGRRAEVVLPDGATASCAVPDARLIDAMRRGELVWLDGQGHAVLHHRPGPIALGEEGRLERRLPSGDVEVSVGDTSRLVCRASHHLDQQLRAGEAAPGSTLIVCPRRMFAFLALPPEDGLAHLQFVARQPVPDVVVERDLGAPPPFIEALSRHVRRELVNPELGRRYRLRRSRLLLATGVAGSGKTHAIHALWNNLYRIMSKLTGVAVEDLPPRVLRLEAARVLSKWFGDSDRAIARFFDEVAQIADERFEAPDGRVWELPVLVICEEVDALARSRGEDTIYDRIQATLLQRLDPAQPLYRDRLVIVVCTSNVPDLLDVAFVRRAGGMLASFGRLDRFSFRAVLEKQLRDLPLRDREESRRRVLGEISSWLFAPNGSDPGQVELTYVAQPNPVRMYRRDFLTAGLVDRAVQEASQEACDAAWSGAERPGLSTESLCRAIDAQVRGIVDRLVPGNCGQYLTLPDGARVASLRRVPQPALLPIELERAS